MYAHGFVEHLWTIYAPYADCNFPQEIQLHLHERFWEMYLTCALLEIGLNVKTKRNPEGPDVHVELNGKTIWFEATCPTQGNQGKLDSVPDIMACDGELPIDQIVLRIRNAIKEKYDVKYFQQE